jgi:hypothetical protein
MGGMEGMGHGSMMGGSMSGMGGMQSPLLGGAGEIAYRRGRHRPAGRSHLNLGHRP